MLYGFSTQLIKVHDMAKCEWSVFTEQKWVQFTNINSGQLLNINSG
jgi:hypothetical protein